MEPSSWAELTHAYGAADNVEGLLAAARVGAPPTSSQDEPWFSLWSALAHQGDVYTASYRAVPELIDIAASRTDRVAVECLHLAAVIELDRQRPGAPEIPLGLAAAYAAALRRGRKVAQGELDTGDDASWVRKLADSVFAGRFEEARALVDAD
jgi:hypothetical protein